MGYVKAFLKRVYQISVKYPLAIAGTVILIIVAILFAAFGKKFQIGGLIGKLWDREPSDPNVRVVPKKERVDGDGKPIQPGKSDDRGYVQPVAVKVKEPSIFDDPDIIVVEHPEKGEVKLPLPVGVKNDDVEEVLEIEPDVYEIGNNDRGVDVDRLLEKI